jgi:hypothetical protein
MVKRFDRLICSLQKNSKLSAARWKGGASAPRKSSTITAGFSPGGRTFCFPQPVGNAMGLDIRLPVGLLFSMIRLLLVAFGAR